MCIQHFGQLTEIFWKKVLLHQLFHLLGIETDSGRHALDADSGPDLAK
jgi:hypothetical protein